MNVELLRELGGEVPLLSQCQLRFLDDVNLVVENTILIEDIVHLPEDEEVIVEIMEKISAIEENVRAIIGRLKIGRNARRQFLQMYPKWKKIREDSIEKLREIAHSITTDRFNCNVSKLVGYSTSLVGGGVTLASAILIPFTAGLSAPLAIAGGTMIAAGSSTTIGTSVTEAALLKSKVKQAQEIVEEDKRYFQEMNGWLEHAEKLEKALSEILKIDIVKDVVESVKDLVERGTKIQDDYRRLNFIETALNTIIRFLPPNVTQAVPIIAVATVVSVLVALFLLLVNTENRLVFDCASLTVRSIVGVASFADDVFDISRVASFFTSNATLAKDLTKAATRGAVAVLGIALDTAGIVLTSIDIHKGSLSPEAEKITKAADELKEEAVTLQNIYENIS